MIDYSYVECSGSSLGALVEFRKRYPQHRAKEIERCSMLSDRGSIHVRFSWHNVVT